jgi:hypothetical protein
VLQSRGWLYWYRSCKGKGVGAKEQSDELRDLTLRFYEAITTGDLSFLERHVSRQDGAVFVGTDPNEWWEGFEAFVEEMRAQVEAMGGGGLQIVPANSGSTARAASAGRSTVTHSPVPIGPGAAVR